MPIFEYAIIFHPTRKEKEEGTAQPKIVTPPTHCLANDANSAMVLASRAIPEEYLKNLDRVEVAVRPF